MCCSERKDNKRDHLALDLEIVLRDWQGFSIGKALFKDGKESPF